MTVKEAAKLLGKSEQFVRIGLQLPGSLNMKHKFKIGDKVRVLDGSNIKNYTGGWYEHMYKYVGKVYTITGLYEYESGRKAYGVENSFLMFDERSLKLLENKVVITYVKNMTIAKYYENGNCVKTGVARCSPEDTFSEETWAKIALERLFAKSFKDDKVVKW